MIPRFEYFFSKNKNLNLFGDFHDNFKEGNTVAQEKKIGKGLPDFSEPPTKIPKQFLW